MQILRERVYLRLIRQYMSYLIILCVYLAIFLSVLLTQKQIFLPSAGDQPVGFFPVVSGQSLFSSWATYNLGTPVQHSLGNTIFLLIQLVTGSAFIAQLLLYVGLLATGSLGFIFAFRNLHFLRDDLLLVPIALAFSLNWNLFDTLQLLQIAFTASTPFVFLYGVRLLNGIGRLRSNILGLAIGILIVTTFANVGGFGNMLYIVIPIALASLLMTRHWRSVFTLLRRLGAVGLAIILATLIGLPFFYGGYLLLLTGGFHHYVSVSSGGSLTETLPLSHLFYLSSLMPYEISPFLAGSSPNLSDVFWPLSLSAVVLASFAVLGNSGLRRSLALAFTTMLLVLLSLIQLILINSPVVNTLYAWIPLLFVLIEAQNYLYTITPLWFILAGLGVAALEARSWNISPLKINATKTLAVVLAVLTLTSSVSAFGFEPLAFSRLYQGAVDPGYPGFPAQTPQSIVNEFISIQQNRSTEGPFRVLWLPYPLWLAQMFYAAGTPDALNLLSLGNMMVTQQVYGALSPILNKSTNDFGRSIAPFGFKYILVPTYFNESQPISFETVGTTPVSISGNPQLFVGFLSSQKDVKLIKQGSTYMLYENMAIPAASSGVFWLSNSTSGDSLAESQGNSSSLGQVAIDNMSPTYSPSSYVLTVNANGPEWLVFDQSYDGGWSARIPGETQALNHTHAMGWANAFFIPHAGQFAIHLDYGPQLQYDYAWMIGGFVTACVVAFLVLSNRLERRRNYDSNRESGGPHKLSDHHSKMPS